MGDGAELGEVGTLTEVRGWSALTLRTRPLSSVTDRAPQSRERTPGSPWRANSCWRHAVRAAVGGGVEPAGDGARGILSEYSVFSRLRHPQASATTDDGADGYILAPHAPRSHPQLLYRGHIDHGKSTLATAS